MRDIQTTRTNGLLPFSRTREQAEQIYRLASELDNEEKYLLLRYLDLLVPKGFEDKYGWMSDAEYHRKLRLVFRKLPADAQVLLQFKNK
jgi:hypothetical protein